MVEAVEVAEVAEVAEAAEEVEAAADSPWRVRARPGWRTWWRSSEQSCSGSSRR